MQSFVYICLISGPASWSTKYPLCGGHSQSPINIETTSPAEKKNIIRYHNYDVLPIAKYYMVKNTGHNLQMDLAADTKYILLKGYEWWVPMQVHIHFGVKYNGSEHKINGHKYQAEVWNDVN